jgi:tRNA(fMet)-specific endonuclease VapC
MNGNEVMLDTNIVSAAVEQETAVLNKLAAVTAIIPIIVLGELYYGAYASTRVESNLQRVEALLEDFSVLVCDEDTARQYGVIRARLKKKGRPIPENDVWIAALASQHDLPLVTRDKHFAEVDGLTIESW